MKLDGSSIYYHDIAVVAEVADRVIMKNGKIVEQGDVDNIFSNRHPYTKKLTMQYLGLNSMKEKIFLKCFESEIIKFTIIFYKCCHHQ